MLRLRSLAVALFVLSAPACDDAEAKRQQRRADFAAEHGDTLKARAKALEEITADAKTHEPVTGNKLSVDGPIDFRKTVKSDSVNARVARLETLTGEGKPFLLPMAEPRWIENYRKFGAGTDIRSITDLQEIQRVRYVLVLRAHEVVEPKLTTGLITKFDGGKVAGDALLYDLDGAKYLGGFAFSANNSAEINASVEHKESSLRGDLIRNAANAIQEQLKASVKTLELPLEDNGQLRYAKD